MSVVIGLRKIREACERIRPMVRQTPLIVSSDLSQRTNKHVTLKLETTHDIGAFKVRGAANKILQASKKQQKQGVTAFSTGNHGLAVSFVAQKLGIPAHIAVSKNVPETKRTAIENMGGSVDIFGDSQEEAGRHCQTLQNEQGMLLIPPFDDPDIIAGQGTIGMELLQDMPEIDTAIIPVSGGGLISGTALALKLLKPSIKIIGVTLNHSAAMYESLQKGYPVQLKEETTLADSLLGGIGLDNQYTLPLVRHYVDDLITISEADIAESMGYLYTHQHLMVEGAAAVGIHPLLANQLPSASEHIAVILTGKNVDSVQYLQTITRYMQYP